MRDIGSPMLAMLLAGELKQLSGNFLASNGELYALSDMITYIHSLRVLVVIVMNSSVMIYDYYMFHTAYNWLLIFVLVVITS